MEAKDFSAVTPEIEALAAKSRENNRIDISLYDKYEVKRGLRDLNGKGVLTGLTEISEVKASEVDENGVSHPCDGKLYYRGHDVEKLIEGFTKDKRFGFEEVTYLLLFGELPDKKQLADFNELLGNYRCIPPNFVRDIIMKKPSRDIMNAVARSVLMLYAYDDKADDTSVPNVVRQSLQLISELPLLAVYSYQAYRHFHVGGSLIIHEPDPKLSTAENILHLSSHDFFIIIRAVTQTARFSPAQAQRPGNNGAAHRPCLDCRLSSVQQNPAVFPPSPGPWLQSGNP